MGPLGQHLRLRELHAASALRRRSAVFQRAPPGVRGLPRAGGQFFQRPRSCHRRISRRWQQPVRQGGQPGMVGRDSDYQNLDHLARQLHRRLSRAGIRRAVLPGLRQSQSEAGDFERVRRRIHHQLRRARLFHRDLLLAPREEPDCHRACVGPTCLFGSEAGNAARVDVQGVEVVPSLTIAKGLTLSGNVTVLDETHADRRSASTARAAAGGEAYGVGAAAIRAEREFSAAR